LFFQIFFDRYFFKYFLTVIFQIFFDRYFFKYILIVIFKILFDCYFFKYFLIVIFKKNFFSTNLIHDKKFIHHLKGLVDKFFASVIFVLVFYVSGVCALRSSSGKCTSVPRARGRISSLSCSYMYVKHIQAYRCYHENRFW